MKARMLGPVLMMTLGASIALSPAVGWVGALNANSCDQNRNAEGNNDCCGDSSAVPGLQKVCDTGNTVYVTLPSPTTAVVTTITAVVATTAPEVVTPTTNIDVVAPSTTDIGSGGQGLPETGTTSTSYVVLGGLLLIAGAGLLVLGRGKADPLTD